MQKLRYSSDVLERKYEELESKTYKRMEQCVKRVKKAIHYLESLSVKNLDKTREYTFTYSEISSKISENP